MVTWRSLLDPMDQCKHLGFLSDECLVPLGSPRDQCLATVITLRTVLGLCFFSLVSLHPVIYSHNIFWCHYIWLIIRYKGYAFFHKSQSMSKPTEATLVTQYLAESLYGTSVYEKKELSVIILQDFDPWYASLRSLTALFHFCNIALCRTFLLQNLLPLSDKLFIFFLFLALSTLLSLSPIEVLSCHGVRARCAMTHCGELVELSEELVEQLHQLLSRALWRQTGEAHDVCEQDAKGQKEREKRKVPKHHCFMSTFLTNPQYHKSPVKSTWMMETK